MDYSNFSENIEITDKMNENDKISEKISEIGLNSLISVENEEIISENINFDDINICENSNKIIRET